MVSQRQSQEVRMAMNGPLLIGLNDAAASLSVSRKTLDRYRKRHPDRIRTVQVATRVLVPVAELERFAAQAVDGLPSQSPLSNDPADQ
jgi:hypothetical protein